MKKYNSDIVLEHELIREMVGYDIISKIDSYDLPIVINFLEVAKNYIKMEYLVNEIQMKKEKDNY